MNMQFPGLTTGGSWQTEQQYTASPVQRPQSCQERLVRTTLAIFAGRSRQFLAEVLLATVQ